MASDKTVTVEDLFLAVYPKAKDGPAGKFLAERTDENLKLATAMTEYVSLNRRGLNPYREDMVEKMKETEFFAEVSDNELEATRGMLLMVGKMRGAVSAKLAVAKLAEGVKVSNKEPEKVEEGKEEKKGKK